MGEIVAHVLVPDVFILVRRIILGKIGFALV
jgi:hypothetical protein